MSIVDRAIQNVPQEDKSKFQLKKAELLIKMKNIEESKSILDILTNDDNAGLAGIPHILLAKIISQQGTEETDEVSNKNDAARDELFKAYKKAPTDYRVLKEGANLLDELGYTKEALFFRLKQNEQFSNSESWALLGNAYLRLSLNGIALEAYLKANDLAEGEEAWILANIGNLYNNRGLHPLAIDYLRKSDALQPEDKYTTDRLAKAVKNFQEESEKAKEIIDNVTIQINKRIDTVSSGSSRI
jgi:tetratricopeptide (TPR) repeat protein